MLGCWSAVFRTACASHKVGKGEWPLRGHVPLTNGNSCPSVIAIELSLKISCKSRGIESKTRVCCLEATPLMSSFLSIPHYSPFLVLLVGLLTFVGLWGLGTVLLSVFR